MAAADVREFIAQLNPEAILWDGLDSCLIGISAEGRAIYSIEELILHFQVEEQMSEQDAAEHVDYNILGAYVGEYTPIHMYSLPNQLK